MVGNNSGFSLISVMLAVAISGIVVMATTSSLTQQNKLAKKMYNDLSKNSLKSYILSNLNCAATLKPVEDGSYVCPSNTVQLKRSSGHLGTNRKGPQGSYFYFEGWYTKATCSNSKGLQISAAKMDDEGKTYIKDPINKKEFNFNHPQLTDIFKETGSRLCNSHLTAKNKQDQDCPNGFYYSQIVNDGQYKMKCKRMESDNLDAWSLRRHHFANQSVLGNHLIDQSVKSNHLVAKTLTGSQGGGAFKDAQFTSDKIAPSAIATAQIADANVLAQTIANNSVDSGKIFDRSIAASLFGSNSITQELIGDGAIAAAKVASNTIVDSKIANEQIVSSIIKNQTLGNSHFEADSIASTNIINNSMNANQLFRKSSITAAKIKPNTFGSREVANQAITSAKASNGYTGKKTQDQSIGIIKLNGDSCMDGAFLTVDSGSWVCADLDIAPAGANEDIIAASADLSGSTLNVFPAQYHSDFQILKSGGQIQGIRCPDGWVAVSCSQSDRDPNYINAAYIMALAQGKALPHSHDGDRDHRFQDTNGDNVPDACGSTNAHTISGAITHLTCIK